jgi:ferredoxin
VLGVVGHSPTYKTTSRHPTKSRRRLRIKQQHFRHFSRGTARAIRLGVPNSNRRGFAMAHVVTVPCVGCKYTDCVVVCPMECFYGDDQQLYIDPDDCIDCGACIPECPVEAIFLDADVPAKWSGFVQLNADRVTVLKPLGARVTEKR